MISPLTKFREKIYSQLIDESTSLAPAEKQRFYLYPTVNAITQAARDLVLDLIGEDEPVDKAWEARYGKPDLTSKGWPFCRNQLRSEIRAKLKETSR